MSISLNCATLIGHLGADPEIRRTQDGRPVVNFSVATGERWRDKTTGEQREATEWHRVVIFNEGLCKVAEQYLEKGSKVYVEGQIRTRKWQDKDGQDRWTTEIVLGPFNSQLIMLDRAERPAQSEADYGTQRTVQPAGQAGGNGNGRAGAAGRGSSDPDDEIPF